MIIFLVLAVIAGAVIITISLTKILSISEVYEKANDVYSDLSEKYVTEIEMESLESNDENDPLRPAFIWDYEKAHAEYPDIVGYIHQENTEYLSYPILQGATNETYVRHLITGEYNIAGSIFVDSDCLYALKSNYSIVYGHNMKNHSMFGSLLCYRDPDYCEGHETFDIYVEDRHYRYHLYSVCTSPADGDIFTLEFGSEEEFIELFKDIKKRSDYEIDDGLGEVTADDHFICLTTCTYDLNYAYRYTIIIRRGEEYDDRLYIPG